MIKKRIQETIENLSKLSQNEKSINEMVRSAELIIESIKSGGKVMICGNGGSAADAQHMAGEFLCKFYKVREPMPAIALTADTSILTSIANDFSYDKVFSRQVSGIGRRGDVLIGISTSGTSKNVFEAFSIAREKGITTILLTGNEMKNIAEISDVVILTPSKDTPRIQEMHLMIEHILCEIIEEKLHI
jgi:D-sedoheptulose 7-phosphate isomerase